MAVGKWLMTDMADHALQRCVRRASAPPDLLRRNRRATRCRSAASTAPMRHLNCLGAAIAPPRAAAPPPPRLCAAWPTRVPPPRHRAPQCRLCRASAPPDPPGCCRCATMRRCAASAAPLRLLTRLGAAAAPPRAAALLLPRLSAAWPAWALPPRHHAPPRRLRRVSAPPGLPGCCHRATTGRSAASAAPLHRLAYPGAAARAAAPHPPRLCAS